MRRNGWRGESNRVVAAPKPKEWKVWGSLRPINPREKGRNTWKSFGEFADRTSAEAKGNEIVGKTFGRRMVDGVSYQRIL